MAPKADCPKLPPMTFLGPSAMAEGLIANMLNLGMLADGAARPPPSGDTSVKPRNDEVVFFRDFFVAGLRIPSDPAFVNILRLYQIYTHQLTPTSFVRLNLILLAGQDVTLLGVR